MPRVLMIETLKSAMIQNQESLGNDNTQDDEASSDDSSDSFGSSDSDE